MTDLKLIKINNIPENTRGALTLSPAYIGRHDNGWEIVGTVHEDYFECVNRFVAYKHDYCYEEIVCGDFEDAVYATSQKAYDEFVSLFPPESWDYDDIEGW